ncbi:hypothetical protein HDF17_002216 [Granulicella arctica]|uniref:Uncharacterized protein n=1 Tax=Granulicella arctica TaxID=940613 RepID=A0A7Y9PIS5_9BACT|nr:hypothetical protein [Granulicella arctica]
MESSEAQIKSGLFSSWGLAAVSCAVGEIILISLQIHFGSNLQSLSFWYVPFAFTAPMFAGMGAIKKLRNKTHEPERLAELSHELGILVSTANMTVVICIVSFILRGNR